MPSLFSIIENDSKETFIPEATLGKQREVNKANINASNERQIAVPRASDKRPTVLRDNGVSGSCGWLQLEIEALSLLWGLLCFWTVFSARRCLSWRHRQALHLPGSVLQLLPGSLPNPHNPFPHSPPLWWPLKGQNYSSACAELHKACHNSRIRGIRSHSGGCWTTAEAQADSTACSASRPGSVG